MCEVKIRGIWNFKIELQFQTMKTNHISTKERLQQRICKLEERVNSAIIKTSKRFYLHCRHCDTDTITIYMEDHKTGCKLRGIDKQIRYYRNLLNECS